MNKENDLQKNWASGICIVHSNNSNFNADISHTPRRLPDKNGTIYATDKALKYCVRKYLNDVKNEKIFMWRRLSEKHLPLDINENYQKVFNKDPKNKNRKEILDNLLTCRDVRLFGCTFAGAENIAVHGTTQISYGINMLDENITYSNQILSPFRNLDKKKEKAQQTTTGDESKSLDVCYVFDYNVNPNNIVSENDTVLKECDVIALKKALCYGVNYVNSTTKIGAETLLVLHAELNRPKLLQNLKKFVKITGGKSKVEVNISEVISYLKKLDENIEKVEIFYEKEKINLKRGDEWAKIKEFDTLQSDI